MSRRQERHFQAFARVLSENSAFEMQIKKLTTFEFEVLCISSTELQLRNDLDYFTADEVTTALLLGIINHNRREEVRDKISRSSSPRVASAYRDIRAAKVIEEHRVRDLAGWITCTLNKDSIQRLINQLNADLVHSAEPPIVDDIPSSPSELSADVQSLLHITHAAGGKVPYSFFEAGYGWTESGVPQPVQVQVPEVLADPDRRAAAITLLLDQRLLIDMTISGDPERFFAVHPDVSSRMNQTVDASWKAIALAVICRAFPRWPHIRASPQQCQSLLPTLRIILSYLPEICISGLEASLVDVCISASYFSSLEWKETLLKVAASVNPGDPVLVQRIKLRYRMLHRLSCKDGAIEQASVSEVQPAVVNPRSNFYYGEQIIFEMKCLVERNVLPTILQDLFVKIRPFGPEPSIQERQLLLHGQELIARGMRFQGRFKEAKDKYFELLQDFPKEFAAAKFTASTAEVLCEAGNSQHALQLLKSELSSRNTPPGTRLQMALAHVYLTKALWHYYRNGRLDEDSRESLGEAKTRYTNLQYTSRLRGVAGSSKTDKETCFVACAGIAIIAHILALDSCYSPSEGSERSSSQRAEQTLADEDAFRAWVNALEAARIRWPAAGFSEMITLYAQSELAYRLQRSDAGNLTERARHIFYATGRQYFYVAHGTVWLEVLESCIEKSGRIRMTPRWTVESSGCV